MSTSHGVYSGKVGKDYSWEAGLLGSAVRQVRRLVLFLFAGFFRVSRTDPPYQQD